MIERIHDRVAPFPDQALVNPQKPGQILYIDEDHKLHADATVAKAFEVYNEAYLDNPDALVKELYQTKRRYSITGTYGQTAHFNGAHFTHPKDADSKRLLIVTSPLDDVAPASSMQAGLEYVRADNPTFRQVAAAQPNSLNPATKLSTGFHFSVNSGMAVPMGQIYSGISPRAMSLEDRRKLLTGDYRVWGKFAMQLYEDINNSRKQEGKAELEEVDFFGAGIGQRALGAAHYMQERGVRIGSVHLVNLALQRGPKVVSDHVRQLEIDEPSQLDIPRNYVEIPESLLRQRIERRREMAQMYIRQGKDVSHLLATILPLMFKYEPSLEDANALLDSGAIVRVSNGHNTAMAHNTLSLLPLGHPNLRYTSIVAKKGQKVGMGANEHATLVALLMSQGLVDAGERSQQP